MTSTSGAAGLRIRLRDGWEIEIQTDVSWNLVPEQAPNWPFPKLDATVENARVIRRFDTGLRPRVYEAPVSVPELKSFWQRRWFQVSLIAVSAAAILGGLFVTGMLLLKFQSERLVRRERARMVPSALKFILSA